MNFDERTEAFLAQAETFLAESLHELGISKLSETRSPTKMPAQTLQPILLSDFRNISKETQERITLEYFGEVGVAHFIVQNPLASSGGKHALLEIAEQLAEPLGLR